MAIVLTNAKVFLAGYNISGDLNRVAVEYEAEALDATVFGNDSRVMKGGLKAARVNGAGFWQAGSNAIDPVLFDGIGFDDGALLIYPEGITEGATSTGSGYMFRVTQARYQPGGTVGDLLPFSFEAQGRGVGS